MQEILIGLSIIENVFQHDIFYPKEVVIVLCLYHNHAYNLLI